MLHFHVTDVVANISVKFLHLYYLYFILRYDSYISYYFLLLYFSSNRHSAFDIQHTSYNLWISLQPVVNSTFVLARAICLWNFDLCQLNSVYIVDRSSCRVRFNATHCSTHVITWIFLVRYIVLVTHNW